MFIYPTADYMPDVCANNVIYSRQRNHVHENDSDPGRIRRRIYDTPNVLDWAAKYLLGRLYIRPQITTRDDAIRERHAGGARVTDLARAFGLTPARISQIIRYTR